MSIKKGTVTIASSTPATEWGSIEGTLADQQDLKNALDSKIPYLSPALTGTPTAPTAQVGTNTNQIATTKFVKSEIEDALQNVDLLPDQTGNDGKYLKTDGAVASWERVDALPDQTGQSGKVLTTNGTTASWTEYSPTPDVDGETIHLNSSDELEVIGTIEKNAGDVKYDWVGTYAEWEAGRNNNTIPDDWVCYITDDFVSSTVTHNIGDIFYSLRYEDMFNGAVVCDGSQYDIANYSEDTNVLRSKDFYESIFGDLTKVKNSDKLYFINCYSDNFLNILLKKDEDKYLIFDLQKYNFHQIIENKKNTNKIEGVTFFKYGEYIYNIIEDNIHIFKIENKQLL